MEIAAVLVMRNTRTNLVIVDNNQLDQTLLAMRKRPVS